MSDYPTVHYDLAYLFVKTGDERKANRFYRSANRCPTDYCFPFRLETLEVLREAIAHNPQDARAHYYMGNLLYDLQPNEAIQQWEKAVQLEHSLAIAHRNLGWGYYYAQDEITKAISSYEKAVRHNPKEPRYHYELDLLYERDGTPVERRLETLQKHHEHVKKREDALIREIIVLVLAGKYDKAIDYLQSNYFHIQEGNRRLHDTHVDAYLLRGLSSLREQKHRAALDDFLMADEYPENHQIGRDRAYRRNPQINYYIGLCHQTLGQASEADARFKKAVSQGVGKSEYIYYVGLGYQQLGQDDRASELFDQLIQVGQQRLGEAQQVDFFAKFGEGELPHVRRADSHYMMGLGYLGKGSLAEAKEHFQKAVELDVNHIWARYHLDEAL
jgi:tetratricopeptide (TPR) repeat protein